MRFSVFAISAVPDTAAARRLFGLQELDDKSVSKVLFHRRKQQTGSSEQLRWDQRALGAITLIQHSVDSVNIESLSLATHSEEDMLNAFYRVTLRNGHMVSWDGGQALLPLLHFRSLVHGVSYPAYWQAQRERGDVHLDVCGWLSSGSADRPGLDETARRLGFPGLLTRSEDSLLDAWLEQRYADVQAYSDVCALNTYLLALRLFGITGEMTRHDGARVKVKLRDELGRRAPPHFAEFLAAWGDA